MSFADDLQVLMTLADELFFEVEIRFSDSENPSVKVKLQDELADKYGDREIWTFATGSTAKELHTAVQEAVSEVRARVESEMSIHTEQLTFYTEALAKSGITR